ncbi:hypothetical protein CELL_00898 [Cellulomonas sp. T2.31MG-18]|uniref:MerR family transcriptional regulator n=1 Tax=Cellulomonas sp. T2.31MG-18 TaxID=3157619 RepID=UPI0035EE33CF
MAEDEQAAHLAPALTVAAVARRLGVAPATLRTWDRRYGLGPSEHPAGSHRRYGAEDLARLLVMRRLTIDGVAPGEAARIALATEVSGGSLLDAVPDRVAVPAPSASRTPGPVVDAALAGDGEGCAALLRIGAGGDVVSWWTALVEPALEALSRRTVIDRPGADAETVLRAAALGALRDVTPDHETTGQPVVLVLVPSGAPRPLLAHALAAALVQHGVDARVVGGPLSGRHAVELVAMTRAGALVTVSQQQVPDLAPVARLAEDRPEVPHFVMVPDSAAELLPLGRSVHRARTFTGLLHEVLAALGESGGTSSHGGRFLG